jgi:hypothetical protein
MQKANALINKDVESPVVTSSTGSGAQPLREEMRYSCRHIVTYRRKRTPKRHLPYRFNANIFFIFLAHGYLKYYRTFNT